MRVDTQAHVVSEDHAAYPLNPPTFEGPPTILANWFDAPALGVDDLLARMDASGIDRAVLVQAFSSYQYDNRYTAAAAAAHPDRLASSCIVDLDNDPIDAIRHWVNDCGARAIRLFLRNFAPDWLLQAGADEVFTELVRLGVIAQAVAAADDLPLLLQAAKRHPDVVILLDHCGLPDLSGGPSYPLADNLFALAEAPNINVKLSTHVFSLAKSAGSSAAAITERLVATFGAARVMWATDYSVLGLVYADCVEEAEAACAGLSQADRALVMGDAAAPVWWPAG